MRFKKLINQQLSVKILQNEAHTENATCNEMVAPDVAPMSQPNNKPPKAGNRNLTFIIQR